MTVEYDTLLYILDTPVLEEMRPKIATFTVERELHFTLRFAPENARFK